MKSLLKVLGCMFIAIGLLIIYPIVEKKIETYKMQQNMREIFENQEYDEKVEIIKDDITSENGEITEEPQPSSNENFASDNFDLSSVGEYVPVALMEIPSIDLSQMVVDGTADNVLQYYLGRLDSTVAPGDDGNLIICGHRVSDYTDAFINLYKVEVGDKVILKTQRESYTYEITESYVVNPEQVEVLDQTEEATITLITCTVGAKQRLILKGKLV